MNLDTFLRLAPILASQILLELRQHRLRRAHDALAVALPQRLQVFLAHHAAVRFVVWSPKTARHKGKDLRIVPLFPELRVILEKA